MRSTKADPRERRRRQQPAAAKSRRQHRVHRSLSGATQGWRAWDGAAGHATRGGKRTGPWIRSKEVVVLQSISPHRSRGVGAWSRPMVLSTCSSSMNGQRRLRGLQTNDRSRSERCLRSEVVPTARGSHVRTMERQGVRHLAARDATAACTTMADWVVPATRKPRSAARTRRRRAAAGDRA